MQSKINQEFVDDFMLWLQGRSKYNSEKVSSRKMNADGTVAETIYEIDGTPWGNKPLFFVPGVDKFLDQAIDRRADTINRITKLKLRGPRDLNEAYLYYKYIVRRLAVDGETIKEFEQFSDYDLPTKDGGGFVSQVNAPLPARHNKEIYDETMRKLYDKAMSGTTIDDLEKTKSYFIQVTKGEPVSDYFTETGQNDFGDAAEYLDLQKRIKKVDEAAIKEIFENPSEREAILEKAKIATEELIKDSGIDYDQTYSWDWITGYVDNIEYDETEKQWVWKKDMFVEAGISSEEAVALGFTDIDETDREKLMTISYIKNPVVKDTVGTGYVQVKDEHEEHEKKLKKASVKHHEDAPHIETADEAIKITSKLSRYLVSVGGPIGRIARTYESMDHKKRYANLPIAEKREEREKIKEKVNVTVVSYKPPEKDEPEEHSKEDIEDETVEETEPPKKYASLAKVPQNEKNRENQIVRQANYNPFKYVYTDDPSLDVARQLDYDENEFKNIVIYNEGSKQLESFFKQYKKSNPKKANNGYIVPNEFIWSKQIRQMNGDEYIKVAQLQVPKFTEIGQSLETEVNGIKMSHDNLRNHVLTEFNKRVNTYKIKAKEIDTEDMSHYYDNIFKESILVAKDPEKFKNLKATKYETPLFLAAIENDIPLKKWNGYLILRIKQTQKYKKNKQVFSD